MHLWQGLKTADMILFAHWSPKKSEIIITTGFATQDNTFDISIKDNYSGDILFNGWVMVPKNGYTPITIDTKYTQSSYFSGIFVQLQREGTVIYERDIHPTLFNGLKPINVGDFQIYSRENEQITASIEYFGNFWEWDHMEQFSQHLEITGKILDIGANIGNHCLMFRKYFPLSKILAFEPLQYNWEVLQKNVSTQPNIDTFKVALSDKLGILKINNHFQEFNSGAASVSDMGESVVCMPLDYLELEEVSFMKIDVEGWEPHVIRGAIRTIEKNKPAIWLEDVTGETVKFIAENLDYYLKDRRGGENFLLLPKK